MAADPLATVERIYAHFHMRLTDEARRAMRTWLEDSANHTPKGRRSLAEYGLDEAAIDHAFGDYLEYYRVSRERIRE
jgi:hypothetical protein